MKTKNRKKNFKKRVLKKRASKTSPSSPAKKPGRYEEKTPMEDIRVGEGREENKIRFRCARINTDQKEKEKKKLVH